MRRTSRLLAAVKASKYLETGAPTGLTGLFTHPAPRSTLLYIYANTLEKLKALPEDSVYRKSTEALTKQRMEILDAVKPAGYEAWAKKAQEVIAKHPEKFNKPEGGEAYDKGRHVKEVFGKQIFVTSREEPEYDEREVEWDGQKVYGGELEGTRSDAERNNFDELKLNRPGEDDEQMIDLEVEPPLTADQIAEIEDKIGAGLIEEVIQVAEGELELVDVMTKAKVWEDLEEKPVEGQWTYFERKE